MQKTTLLHEITNFPNHYAGRCEGSECSRRRTCGKTIYTDWHQSCQGILHTYWHRPKAREGSLERTRPACGIGSSLEVCAPKVRREVTQRLMNRRAGLAVLYKILWSTDLKMIINYAMSMIEPHNQLQGPAWGVRVPMLAENPWAPKWPNSANLPRNESRQIW